MSERLTLYVVEASNTHQATLMSVYARDEQHAREQAKDWFEAQKERYPEHRIYHRPHRELLQCLERLDPEW